MCYSQNYYINQEMLDVKILHGLVLIIHILSLS